MKRVNLIDQEPVFTSTVLSQGEFISAINWYNQNNTEQDFRDYLVIYLKDRINKMKESKVPVNKYTTAGIISRIISRGGVLAPTEYVRFNDQCDTFIEDLKKYQVEINEDNKNIVNLQERIQNKTDEYIGQLENIFDQVFFTKTLKIFDAYKWMIGSQIKAVHANRIAEHFERQAEELKVIIKDRKKDSYLKESYPRSDKEMKEMIEFCVDIAVNSSKIAANKLASRKPRKKKVVSLEKKIAKVNYKKEDTQYKLVSISPTKILGAEKLWIFNIKTRQLGAYVAKDASGLNIKGSTLEGFSEDLSIGKKLRKPEAVLNTIVSGGKVALRKALDVINAKPQKLKGRLNKDTVLIRIE